MKWPSRDIFLLYLGLTLLLNILFLLIYGGSNLVNTGRSEHYSLNGSWELGVPLIPAMIYPYLSVGLFILLPVFTLNRDQLLVLAKRIAAAIVIAGLIFNLVPTELEFERDIKTGATAPLFELIYLLDRPHNLFPSLHIALSSIILFMVLASVSTWWRLLLAGWWLLLCLSVLFVHQHHLLDIAGGLILAGLLCLPYSGADD